MLQTYYQILNLPTTATRAEIRRSFLDLSRRFHPDKIQNSDLDRDAITDRYKLILDAYKTLYNDDTRRLYDNSYPMPVFQFDINAQGASSSNNANSTTSRSGIRNKTLIERISRAVFNANLNGLNQLYSEFIADRVVFTASEKVTLNWLLAESARMFANDIALGLIKFGADVNHYGEFAKFNYTEIVECYFCDMLVYWKNYDLFKLIGVDQFDLSIYAVSPYISDSLTNSKINRNNYQTSNPFAFENAENLQGQQFINYRLCRLLWISKFCHWAIENHDLPLLEKLDDLSADYVRPYNLFDVINASERHEYFITHLLFFKPYSTKSLIAAFVRANNYKCGSSLFYKAQVNMDLFITIYFSRMFENFKYTPDMRKDYLTILNDGSEESARIMNVLSKLYKFTNGAWASLFFLSSMVGALVLTKGIVDTLKPETRNTGIALDVVGGILALPLIILHLQLLLSIAMRVMSFGQLEIGGSFRTVVLRAYTNMLLADVAAVNRKQTIVSEPSSDFLGFLYNQSPQLTVRLLDQDNLDAASVDDPENPSPSRYVLHT